ncbi:hypothetical protein E2C01_060297 [Portunus trituberculatus]|uniref:Uncharacterized protein n=1 Tax=Portunus trituberculatus TaxID=210409 RepID=A0A5B7H4U9_PORTR|nr:hypothetical protein [Portunus trituberculatus]
MWGPVMMNIGMGGVLEGLPVIITALEDPYLLGIDFLTCVGASLGPAREKVKGTWPGSTFDSLEVILSMRRVNSRVECLAMNQELDIAKMMTVTLRAARAVRVTCFNGSVFSPTAYGEPWISPVSGLHMAHTGEVLHELSSASPALPLVDEETVGRLQ